VMDVGGNTLLVWVHRAKVGPFMNALHFCYGLGAFLSPLIIAQAMIATGGIRWGYWLLALYLVPIIFMLLRLASPRHEDAHISGERRPIPVNWQLTGLVMFFMFVYAGAEVAMGGWLYSYAVALGLADATSAAYLTSVYWGALTLGRLLSIPIAARFRPRLILWVDLIGGLASLGLIILLRESSWALWAGSFGMGLFIASIFPTVITWSERRMTMSGLVTSMFLVGAMFFPWLIGQLFEPIGPPVAMIVIFVALLVCGLVFMALMAFGGSPRTEGDELA
jgi:FHS family Na+ dependent glucose MFS transporter 1